MPKLTCEWDEPGNDISPIPYTDDDDEENPKHDKADVTPDIVESAGRGTTHIRIGYMYM